MFPPSSGIHTIVIIVTATLLGFATSLVAYMVLVDNSKGSRKPDLDLESPICNETPNLFSTGSRILFTSSEDMDRKKGSDRFAEKDYIEAIEFFQRSAGIPHPHPESVIYLNNAKAQFADSTPYRIAVAIPIAQGQSRAEEILRGVAHAQTIFNQKQKQAQQPQLEVEIVNDKNDVTFAKCVAEKLTQDESILAVIGHGSSKITQEVLPIYTKANLTIISPTSTSTSLGGKTFFRTVPSNQATGQALANYLESISIDRVGIFYIPEDSYSNSLYKAFADSFNGEAKPVPNLDADDFNPVESLKSLEEEGISTAILIPNTDSISRAVQIADANAQLFSSQKLTLLGGDSLYNSDFLVNGSSVIAGIVLAVPWYPQNQGYAQKAENFWGGQVSWRTALSYDAAQAITSTLTPGVDRFDLPQELALINLSSNQTSGNPLRFDSQKNRQSEPQLVQVCAGVPRPEGAVLGFGSLEICNENSIVELR